VVKMDWQKMDDEWAVWLVAILILVGVTLG